MNMMNGSVEYKEQHALTNVCSVAQVGIVWKIQIDQKESDDVDDKAENNNRIPPHFLRCSCAHQAESNSAKHLTDTDKNPR